MVSPSFPGVASFASLVASFPVVGFSGSRRVGSAPAALAASFAGGLAARSSFSGSVAVGCAGGVDAAVRGVFPSAVVFRVQRPVGGGAPPAWAFAARSSVLVRSVVAGRGVLVVCPLGACPAEVVPSSSFRGCGSGSWGSVALALGLGCPVLVLLPSCPSGSFPASAAVASRFSCCGGGLGFSIWWAAPVMAAGAESAAVGLQGSLFSRPFGRLLLCVLIVL